MVKMSGFGDNSTVFQRGATIPQGGLRLEVGEFTQATDTTAEIPTQLLSVVFGMCIVDGSQVGRASIGNTSLGFVDFSLGKTGSGQVIHYIVAGY
jgi:hypothetical protein